LQAPAPEIAVQIVQEGKGLRTGGTYGAGAFPASP
jgi:hypothetical protein